MQVQGEFRVCIYGVLCLVKESVPVRPVDVILVHRSVQLISFSNRGRICHGNAHGQSNVVFEEQIVGRLLYSPKLRRRAAADTEAAGAIGIMGSGQSLVISQVTVLVDIRYSHGLVAHDFAALCLCQNALITDGDIDLHRIRGSSLGCSSIRQQGIRRFFQQQMFRLLHKRLLCGRLRLLFWGLPLLCGSLRFYDQCFRFLNEGFGSTFFQQSFIGQCLHGEHAKHHHDGKKHRQYASFHNCPSFLTFFIATAYADDSIWDAFGIPMAAHGQSDS